MQIYDIQNNLISSFDVYDDAYIEKTHNKLDILFFRVPKSLGFKIQEEGYVEIPEGRFVVKEKKAAGKYYDIVGKPDMEIFESEFIPNYTYTTQSFQSIMNQLLAGTGWTCVCPGLANRTLTGKTKTKWEIIQHALEVFKYEVRYDIKNKIIYADTLLGSDRGAYFHHEINLRELTVSSDTYDFCTKLIPIGKNDMTIEEVNGGLNYVVPTVPVPGKTIVKVWTDERYTVKANLMADAQEKVDIFSKPYRSYEADVIDLARLKPLTYNHLSYQVGDTITLVDKDNETYEMQRVVGKKEYLRDRLKDAVTIANRPKSITETTVKKLTEDITVVKQYIDVLEGEIQAKVSREQFLTDAELKQSITDAVTPGVVTAVRQSEGYLSDIALAAASRDMRLLESLLNGIQKPHQELLSKIAQLPSSDELTTKTNDLNTALTSIQNVYNSIIADSKVDDDEWAQMNSAITAYKNISKEIEGMIVQSLYKEIGNLAQSTNEAFSKITPEYIWNSVSGTETWTNAMSQKADLDSVGKTVDKKIVDYDNNTISTMRNTIQTINEKVIEDGELILEKTKNFNYDTNGLTIDSGGAAALRLSDEMISFLMNGVTGDYWRAGWFFTKNVEVLESLRLPTHTLVKIGTGLAFRPTGR